jgi:hypothetical protein
MKPAVFWVVKPCDLQGCANVSDDPDVSFIYPDEGDRKILRNISTVLAGYMTSHVR